MITERQTIKYLLNNDAVSIIDLTFKAISRHNSLSLPPLKPHPND